MGITVLIHTRKLRLRARGQDHKAKASRPDPEPFPLGSDERSWQKSREISSQPPGDPKSTALRQETSQDNLWKTS